MPSRRGRSSSPPSRRPRTRRRVSLSLETPRVRPRGTVSRSTRSNSGSRNPYVTPSVSSIRDSARDPPRGFNRQTGSSYTLSSRGSTSTPASSGTAPTRRSNVSIAHQLEHLIGRAAPPTPAGPQADSTPRPRYCYCDTLVPESCNACNSDELCAVHPGLFCSECEEWFHVSCTGWNFIPGLDGGVGDGCAIESPWEPRIRIPLADQSQGDHPWYCVRCWEARKTRPTDEPSFPLLPLEEQARRLGVTLPPLPESGSRRAQRATLSKRLSQLSTSLPESLLGDLKASSPRPLPTAKPMDQPMRRASADQGRQFEVSMTLFRVDTCSCCGVSLPVHQDSNVPTTVPHFRQRHLNKKFHPAWHCTCQDVCQGGQFYSVSRSTHEAWFNSKHSCSSPGTFLDLSSPNALLCADCHNYSKDDLDLARPFSARNGFGTIPRQPTHPVDIELRGLLDSITVAEEAAIRQITPLVSVVRLNHGNIGSRGNSTCVFQSSRVNTLLPNLPSECKIVVVEWRQGTGRELRSYQFRRDVIHRILVLLQQTGLPCWANITLLKCA